MKWISTKEVLPYEGQTCWTIQLTANKIVVGKRTYTGLTIFGKKSKATINHKWMSGKTEILFWMHIPEYPLGVQDNLRSGKWIESTGSQR